jgi:predicted SAM-dependent methyltransferase
MNHIDALKHAHHLGLPALDMGAAHNKPDGYLGVDQYPHPNVELVCDVTKGIPVPDSSIGAIRAHDFIEHIPNGIALFNEFHRILAPGGILLTQTPSTDGRGAFQDPTHVSFYNQNSFWYYTDPYYQKFVPAITCQYEALTLETMYPTAWHVTHNIPYVIAHLKAIK